MCMGWVGRRRRFLFLELVRLYKLVRPDQGFGPGQEKKKWEYFSKANYTVANLYTDEEYRFEEKSN